jgi:ssDNA-binding replication factor A large subunit
VRSSTSAVHAIVVEILSKRPDLSEAQILALIEEKKKEGRGLLSDEGAARLVAEELLIQTHRAELGRMQVKDLVSGLNDVTLSGRVLLAWPPQQFQRRDGTPGRVLRLILVDKSGRVRCALWDRHVDIVSRAGNLQGRIVRIGHAYTRQGLTGEPEVHAGDRSSIEIDPQDMPIGDFPEFKELFTQLGNLTVTANQVNAIGIVDVDPRYYTFAKEDRVGSVLRAVLADESGSIPMVAWNERAEELRDLKKGDVLQIVNARVRLDSNARPELHVEARGQASVLPSTPDFLKVPTPKTFKIAELTAQVGSADLTACVLAKSEPRELKRATTGEILKVSTIIIADETGIASLSLWNDKAELVNQLHEGDVIELHGMSVSKRLGELRLSLGKSGRLVQSPVEKKIIPPTTRLNALEASKGLIIVECTVADEPVVRQVVTERGENIDVASFTVRDGLGSVRLTVWRQQVANAAKLRPGTRLRITGLRVRPGLNGQLELSSIPVTKIEPIDQPVGDRPAWQDVRRVIALEPGLTTWVKGVVLDVVETQKLASVCETCGTELRVSENSFLCENCKSTKSGKIVLTGRLRIDDGTGVADVILANQDTAGLTIFDAHQIRELLLKEGKSERVLTEEEPSSLVGKEIEVYATAEPSSSQGRFDLKAKKLVTVAGL